MPRITALPKGGTRLRRLAPSCLTRRRNQILEAGASIDPRTLVRFVALKRIRWAERVASGVIPSRRHQFVTGDRLTVATTTAET